MRFLDESASSFWGPAAGVFASFMWVFTSLFFTAAGRRIGSTAVNTLRLVLAVVFLGATFRVLNGVWWPTLPNEQLVMLALSGLVGLTVCDQALFTAFVDIGPRRALLLMTTSPIVAAAIGFVFLSETIGVLAVLGILLTVGGVCWVVLERDPTRADKAEHPHAVRGVVLACIASVCQAVGALLSKRGMGHGFEEGVAVDPQGATFVRMVFGLLGMAPLLLVYWWGRGGVGHTAAKSRRVGRRSTGYWLTLCGAVVGPYLGVWASLIAYDLAPLGVAQATASLSPVLILPFAALVLRERVTVRAVLGACVAVGGVVMLFLA